MNRSPQKRPPEHGASAAGRFGVNSLRYAPAIVLPAVVSVGAVAIFTRILGPAAYGRYAIVYTSCIIAAAISAGWLQQSVIRYFPRYRANNQEPEFIARLNFALVVAAGATCVVGAVLYPVVARLYPAYSRYCLPATVVVVAWVVSETYRAVIQAQMRAALYSAYRVAFSLLRWGTALALVYTFGRDPIYLIVGPALAYILVAIPSYRSVRPRDGLRRTFLLDWSFLRTLASYGMPMVGWAVTSQLLENADRFVIARYAGTEAVGVYSANYSLIATIVAFAAGPLLLASEPIVMQAWERGDTAGIQKIIQRYTRYFMIVAVPTACLVSVLAVRVNAVVFGEEFRAGYKVAPFLVSGMLLWNLGMYGHKGLKLMEKTGLMLAMGAACAAVNLGLNLMLVPRYGFMAAAWATCAAFALYPVLVLAVTRRYITWKLPWVTVLRTAAAGTIAAAVAHYLNRITVTGDAPALLVAGVGGALAYGTILVITRELSRDEMRQITALVTRRGGNRAD